jgi:CubicO group peptidase (beta-lactamase class C family)
MWCCTNDAVRMDGAWGQFVVIFPKKNAVVVTTAHTTDNMGLLSSIWKRLYHNL